LEDLCPYFGTVWPSARVLALWAWEQGIFAFKGKRVLELGCGLALPSFVVSRFGAEVLATDLHPDVPEFLSRNLAENPGASIRYQHLDWKAPRQLKAPTRYDWILASDVLYESNQAEPLVDFIVQNLARNGKAVITDPGRAYWSTLVRTAESAGLQVTSEEREFKGKDGEKCVVLFLSGTKDGSESLSGVGSNVSGS
jgi:predicted nicotinamide N-methyase